MKVLLDYEGRVLHFSNAFHPGQLHPSPPPLAAIRMSDIPSDFDPSVLFSDYLPPTQPEECPSLPSPPEESHSDELEAIELIIEETRQRYNKEGVVIRHRQLNPEPAFRSSSLPPGEFSWGLWLGGVRVYSVLTRQFQKLPLGTA